VLGKLKLCGVGHVCRTAPLWYLSSIQAAVATACELKRKCQRVHMLEHDTSENIHAQMMAMA
jgi:hypothetical protein